MALELVVLVTWEDTSVYVSVQSVSSVLLREKTTYEWMGILEDTDVENQSLPLVRAMIVRDAETLDVDLSAEVEVLMKAFLASN
jgi:hypothetical protein